MSGVTVGGGVMSVPEHPQRILNHKIVVYNDPGT